MSAKRIDLTHCFHHSGDERVIQRAAQVQHFARCFRNLSRPSIDDARDPANGIGVGQCEGEIVARGLEYLVPDALEVLALQGVALQAAAATPLKRSSLPPK